MIYMWTTYKSVGRVRTYKSITSQLTIFSSSRLHVPSADFLRSTRLSDQVSYLPTPVFWRASANAVETASDLSEPSTFEAAVSGPDQVHWRKAIQAELKSMRLRGVFRAAKLPNGQHAIGTKWVFKIKRKADGSIEKYKARLVAKGFRQNTPSTTRRLFRQWSSM